MSNVSLKGHDAGVRSVAFSPSDDQIASASDDFTVRLWNAKFGSRATAEDEHTLQILCTAWSPCGLKLASGSKDKSVR
eukprot:11009615-Prorocentrum_lima.AAC.1